jgi:hypothetical protein
LSPTADFTVKPKSPLTPAETDPLKTGASDVLTASFIANVPAIVEQR